MNYYYYNHVWINIDNSGEIDFEEFKVALFACDPITGNTMGFNPSKLLTPADAFEMFDEDGSGEIGEDEFSDILEYLGIKVSLMKPDKHDNIIIINLIIIMCV